MSNAKEMQLALQNQQLEEMLQNDEIKELQKRLGGLNFFELCGMNKQETKHSYFLLNLFDVHGMHGWGDAFVRKFCEKAGLHLTDKFFEELRTNSIRREYKFGKNESRVDLLLYADNTVILIENKVDARIHDDQLSKYEQGIDVEEAFKEYNKYYIFLTRDGREPETDNKQWKTVSYGDVIDAIRESQQKVVSGEYTNEYKIIIEHYIKFLRREVIMSVNSLDTEAKSLYEKMRQKYPQALAFLSKAFEDEKITTISRKISEILQMESASRNLILKNGTGIVGTGRIQFQTQKLDELIKRISPNYQNPFLYEISIDGSNDTKKIMKAYAYSRTSDYKDPAYIQIRKACAEYEEKNKRKAKVGRESHVLELNEGKSIDVYDIYDKLTSAPEDDENLGEKSLYKFVQDILDEIEKIENKEIEPKL